MASAMMLCFVTVPAVPLYKNPPDLFVSFASTKGDLRKA